MESNSLTKEEGFLTECPSSCCSSFLSNQFSITVKNVDLQTGLNIVASLSKTFTIHTLLIKRSLRRRPQGSLREPTAELWEGVYA